jgi:type I restriction enzyme, S subunit
MKIPNGWRKVKFGDVVHKVNDKVHSREEWTFDRYIGGEHFDEGEIRITRSNLIEGNEEVIGPAFHMKFKPGQVLYVTRNPRLRKGGMVDFEGVCSNVSFVLEADETQLLQTILPFIIQTEDFVMHTCNNAHGSTNPFLNWKDIANYEFLLPPIEEQKKISEVLWVIEEQVKYCELNLLNNKKFFRKIMVKLFTKGLAKNETYKTKIGDVTKEFNLINLGQECKKIQYGYTESASLKPIGPKFLRITDISSGFVNWDTVPFCKCSDKDFERNKLEKGDIVFARTGASTGATYLFNDDVKAVFASYLIKMQLSENLLPEYVNYFFKSKLYWNQVNATISGSAQGGINSNNLSKLKITLPKIELQKKIIYILDYVNTKLNNIKKYNVKLKNTRNKLSNELLSGNLRLDK